MNEKQWAKEVWEKLDKNGGFSMEEHFVFCVCHLAKHYRDGGAGIKYLTDIYILKEKTKQIWLLFFRSLKNFLLIPLQKIAN